jgi:hypothetical protein
MSVVARIESYSQENKTLEIKSSEENGQGREDHQTLRSLVEVLIVVGVEKQLSSSGAA